MSDHPTPAQPAAWRVPLRALWQWMLHGTSALGLVIALSAAYLYCAPHTALQFGQQLSQWLELRVAGAAVPDRPLGSAPQSSVAQLSPAQQSVADWLARRYSIAPLAMQDLVSRAWQVGGQEHLDPSLILAVIAVESSFNPFAQSTVGATGLMQVMTTVHADKFAPYGGQVASLDPNANLRVGALVLKDAIQRAGSLRAGLQMYAGASPTAAPVPGSYANKVLAERARLRSVVDGVKAAPRNAPAAHAAAAPTRRTAGNATQRDPAA